MDGEAWLDRGMRFVDNPLTQITGAAFFVYLSVGFAQTHHWGFFALCIAIATLAPVNLLLRRSLTRRHRERA